MGTETWIISLPLSDSILYLKIIHPPNFREEPKNFTFLYYRRILDIIQLVHYLIICLISCTVFRFYH